jgi:two-component system, NarL family, sensor kinase
VAVAYNNIAATYTETENFEPAAAYAQKAIDANKAINDTLGLANSYNSLANVYYMEEKDSLSLHYFREALAQRLLLNDSVGLFAGYKNLGAILFEMKDTLQGIAYQHQSLLFIQKTDSARWLSGYLTLAGVYFYSGNLSKAKLYLDSCALYVARSKAFDKLEDYYYTSYKYYQKTGNLQKAIDNFELYGNYRDSIISTSKNEQLAELNVKYEAEKKQKLIDQQTFELTKKNQLLWFVAIGLLLVAIAGYFIYKNLQYRQRTKLQEHAQHQQEIAARSLFEGEQNERIRIARDLHDSVGQMLSLVKMNLSSLDNQDAITQKTSILVDKRIDEVRNVSHNLIPEELNFGIFRALDNLADKVNSSGETQMSIDIPDNIRNIKFEKQNELSIYRIVQEVINNMIRHAEASLINLHIKEDDQHIIISVKDNGRGLDLQSIDRSKGIGWKNINARVHLLDGKINVQSEKLSGTQIEITLPANGAK